jgi:hypothetical protein
MDVLRIEVVSSFVVPWQCVQFKHSWNGTTHAMDKHRGEIPIQYQSLSIPSNHHSE